MLPEFRKQRIFLLFLTSIIVVAAEVNKEREEASFYGESYILTPVEDANSSTSVSLSFRTRQPHGLLFLAAGETDYVIIQLNAGIVETRVNLGSGEVVILSARGVRLDDSRWHEIVVNRTLDSVYMTINGIGQGQGTSPGPYHNLNIDQGVFLGGSGNLEKDVYRNAKSFRGCLRDVYYNGMSVLEEAKNLKKAENTFQVSWHCADEFFAPADSPISFSSETSFVAFPYLRIYPSSSSVFSCDFKTRSSDAILLFNSGKGQAWEDFLAVELVDGRPKLSIDKGSGVIEVYLTQRVNDGRWHQLEVSISQTVTRLQVDGLKNLTRFSLGGQNVLNLANNLYLGGVGFKARSFAIRLGLPSVQGQQKMKGSLLGCIKNVKMNSRSYDFRQIEMSRLIQSECSWDYPCVDDPCLPSAKCVELEGGDFRCDCEQEVCVKHQFKSVSGERNKALDGVLTVQKLEAAYRSTTVISVSTIRLNSDISADITGEENIIFRLIEQPKWGTIEFVRDAVTKPFSLEDLKMNRVVYRHRGGSAEFDSAVFKVSFSSIHHNRESDLKDDYEFVLPIHIVKRHSNTKLKLALGYGNVISITMGAKFQISKSILDVKDYLSDPEKLNFDVKFLRSSRSRFERISQQGKSVLSFTLQELLDGSIWFIHGGDQIVYTTVVAFDGVARSNVIDLRFKVEKLKISVSNNTGLLLDYGSNSLITAFNLSCVTNVKVEPVELLYQVTRSASHGVIQKMDINSNQWMDVQSFTQDDIKSGLVRYSQIPGKTVTRYHELWFDVLAKDVKLSSVFFNVRFLIVTLSVDHEFDLILTKVLFAQVSPTYLSVKSNSKHLNFNNILFTVLRPPLLGFLYLVKTKEVDLDRLQRGKPLVVDDTFTQQDVNDGFIYYRVDRPYLEETEDFIDLHASYFGYTIIVRNRIVYRPSKLTIQIINQGLSGVVEGGSKEITEDMLAVDIDDFSRYTFSILKKPQYGSINVVEPQTSSTLRVNTSHFSMIEILDRQVLYIHDGSEHDADSFTFSVVPIVERFSDGQSEEIQEITGTFQIKMVMINDNAPVRTVSKIFHVASGQTKHITIEDLAFKDPDIDFDSSDLFYHTQRIPNGEILRIGTLEKVFNFTQRDLEDRNLLFRHSGDSYGRAPLLVSDGKFFSNSLFEVQALNPYIAVGVNSGISVKVGQSTVVSGHNLSLESNLDFSPRDVMFDVLEGPKFGQLNVFGSPKKTFSYQDLIKRHVVYVNNGDKNEEDYFRFRVSFSSVRNESNLYIKIALDGIDEPPEIIHNQILEVKALHTELLTENFLCVGHPDYTDDNIEYIVTKLPERGYLMVRGKKAKPGTAPEFTQQEINEGRITYTSESAEIAFDSFIFDVTTEYQSLRNMQFLISIIPRRSQIYRANISVSEGDTTTLMLKTLSLSKQLTQSEKTVIVVENSPSHGQMLIKEGMRQTPVRTFSIRSLSQGLVSYRHDNSETLSDQFSLKVETSDDPTLRREILLVVAVKPIDDEPPKVVANTGLNVWTGSITLLLPSNLHAVDTDSNNRVLFEVVSAAANGHLAFLNNTFRAIWSFSQDDIDNGQVVFVHKGSESGKFKFQATDGVNADRVRVFEIHAKQVRIVLAVKKTILVFPNSLQPITNVSLVATTSSTNYTHPITYSLIRPFPVKGRLVTLRGGRPSGIKAFTQDDIDAGKVFYQHTSQMRTWQETYSMHLEITSTYATTLNNVVVPIQIAFSNVNSGNYKELLGLKTFSLKEGTQKTITQDYFDSTQLLQRLHSFRRDVKVEFSFVSSVAHGSLWFKDMSAEMGGTFTQQEVNDGDLIYNHDHTESPRDSFQFAVKITLPRLISTPGFSSSAIFNFTVNVLPVNDQGFDLLNRDSKIVVTQGLTVVVTARNLTTVDLDTGPEGIEYIILEQPDNGKFVLKSYPTAQISSFTQKEINDGDVIFKHDGSPHGSSSMKFNVWDRKFGPFFSEMKIQVIPIKIQVSRNRSIPIVQGQRSVYLSNDQLKVTTNGDFMSLRYRITQAPQSGKLLQGNSPTSELLQQDLERGMVLYRQDADSSGDDFFVCDIDLTYMDCSLDAVQFDVVIKPLIKQGPLLSTAGSHVAITSASLDVRELAQLTNDNPRFDILEPPKHGQIMRRNRQRRNVDGNPIFSPVSQFTFEDVLFTKIYYVSKTTSAEQDSFSYKLSARGVPPAKGEFMIQLDPAVEKRPQGGSDAGKLPETDDVGHTFTTPSPRIHTSSPPIPDDDDEEEEEEEEVVKGASVQSGKDGDNSAMIIAVVLSSIVLVILVVVLGVLFVRWRRRRRDAKRQEDNFVKPRPYISGPLQLEQPHVFIEPHMDSDESPIREEDTALMRQHHKDEDMMYVNTSHINKSHDMGDTSQWLRADEGSICKTSPVFQHSADEDFEGCSTVTSGRDSNASADLMEWTLMDPDLLQHCYNSQPVLRNNQYWL